MAEQRFNRPPLPSTPREAPWREMEAIIDGLNDVSTKLTNLITVLSGGTAPVIPTTPTEPQVVTPILPHKSTITTGRQQITDPGNALPFPTQIIPDGYPVTILASPDNAGIIFLGKNQSECDDSRKQFNGLAAGLAISLKVKNLGNIWYDGDTLGDWISWIVESDT